MRRCGHTVGIAANAGSQLHIFIVWNQSVPIDNHLRRVDQGNQWGAKGIYTHLLLLVGDADCSPSIGVEHRIHQRLYGTGSSEDVVVALEAFIRIQDKIRIVEDTGIASQHVDGRLQLLLYRSDKGTTDGLSGFSATASLLQLKELLLQSEVLIVAIHEHSDEQTDDGQCHHANYQQLHMSHLCLLLLCLKQVDVTCHICHMQLQRFALGNELKAVLQF